MLQKKKNQDNKKNIASNAKEKVLICNKCSTKCSINAIYCKKCGEKLKTLENKSNNENADLIYKNAIAEMNNKKYKDAEKNFLKYINIIEEKYKNSNSKILNINNCIEFYLYTKYNSINENITNIDCNISFAYHYLGLIKFEQHDYNNAIIFLNKALMWNPYSVASILELAENYKANNNIK